MEYTSPDEVAVCNSVVVTKVSSKEDENDSNKSILPSTDCEKSVKLVTDDDNTLLPPSI